MISVSASYESVLCLLVSSHLMTRLKVLNKLLRLLKLTYAQVLYPFAVLCSLYPLSAATHWPFDKVQLSTGLTLLVRPASGSTEVRRELFLDQSMKKQREGKRGWGGVRRKW